jgi:hypothetical protein
MATYQGTAEEDVIIKADRFTCPRLYKFCYFAVSPLLFQNTSVLVKIDPQLSLVFQDVLALTLIAECSMFHYKIKLFSLFDIVQLYF